MPSNSKPAEISWETLIDQSLVSWSELEPPLKRTQLQLLASACLLLASKLHDPRPMSLLNLVVFTDCSISVPELQSMEMLVLEKLRWELAAPTSAQLLALLMTRMENLLSAQVLSIVQSHASTF